VTNAALNDLLDRLAGHRGWKDGGQFLRLHPVLASPAAVALADSRRAAAVAAGDEPAATAWAATERMLRLCRDHGIPLGLARAATAEAQERLDRTPLGAPERVDNLYYLAGPLADDFRITHDRAPLDRAIDALEDGVTTSGGHPRRPLVLIFLATLLQERFFLVKAMYDLMRSVELAEEAVAVCPVGSPHRARVLAETATCRRRQVEMMARLVDADSSREAIDRSAAELTEALDLTDRAAPERPMRLAQYGTTLKLRYAFGGDEADLDRAIDTWQEASELVQPGSPAQAHALNNVGSALYERYRRLGDRADLQRGVAALQAALDRTPQDAPPRAAIGARLEEAVSELHRTRDG
jgi:hypothetical protein